MDHTKNKSYGIALTDQYTNFRGDIRADIATHLDRAKAALKRNNKSALLGGCAPEQAAARAFYETMIQPYLLKGTLHSTAKEKTFVPDQAYVNNLAAQLCNKGASSQMYIRLLQSRPGELPTDSRVSFATLELLRTWSVRTAVAKELGLNYGVNIVDETEAFGQGETLGFTPAAIKDSYSAIITLLNQYDTASENVIITPFTHQASLYRGTHKAASLANEYERLLETSIEKTQNDIRSGVTSLNTIRAVMIHKLRHGHTFTNVSANTDTDYLAGFPADDVDKTLLVSESFNSALQMRAAVKRHIGQAGLIAAFPEFYSPQARFHWGISKKSNRVSIQPNFKVHGGRLVTPGYALPLYDNDTHECLGLVSYAEHRSGNFRVITGPNGLPAALIKDEP